MGFGKHFLDEYVGSKALSPGFFWKTCDSHFWDELMATKKHFFGYETFSIKDRSEVQLWEDKWLGMLLPFENNIRHCMLLCVIRVI
jgi:hypothetical protein